MTNCKINGSQEEQLEYLYKQLHPHYYQKKRSSNTSQIKAKPQPAKPANSLRSRSRHVASNQRPKPHIQDQDAQSSKTVKPFTRFFKTLVSRPKHKKTTSKKEI